MSNDAAIEDAQIKPRNEDCVLGMVQRSNDAEAKDVQTKSSVEECALGTEHSLSQSQYT